MSNNRSSQALPFLAVFGFIFLAGLLYKLGLFENFEAERGAIRSLEISASVSVPNTNLFRIKITKNESGYEFKDLEIQCEAVGESGTVISSSNHILYKTFYDQGEYYEDIEIQDLSLQASSLICKPIKLELISRSECYMPTSPNEGVECVRIEI